MRRTCAKLCRESGGDLGQIQFLLGHASIQTTKRYLGSRQNSKEAVITSWDWTSELIGVSNEASLGKQVLCEDSCKNGHRRQLGRQVMAPGGCVSLI